jgi:hypothetical protein
MPFADHMRYIIVVFDEQRGHRRIDNSAENCMNRFENERKNASTSDHLRFLPAERSADTSKDDLLSGRFFAAFRVGRHNSQRSNDIIQPGTGA